MEMSPYIHAEFHHNFGDFVEILKQAGYELRDADTGKSVPVDAVQLERLIPDGASINVVAQCNASAR
jgi:hypothetical protein